MQIVFLTGGVGDWGGVSDADGVCWQAVLVMLIVWLTGGVGDWAGVALTFEKLRIGNAQHGKYCISSPASKATISTDLPKIDKHENTNV